MRQFHWSNRWFAGLAAFPTLLTFAGAMALANPMAKAAAPDDAPSAESADSAPSTSEEVTAAGPTAKAASTKAASTEMEDAESTNNKGLWQRVSGWFLSRPPAEPPAPPPPDSEPIPATGVTGGGAPATPAPYVQHLGPESFPGRLRGLYGGSM